MLRLCPATKTLASTQKPSTCWCCTFHNPGKLAAISRHASESRQEVERIDTKENDMIQAVEVEKEQQL
jgi:hypothetical protein